MMRGMKDLSLAVRSLRNAPVFAGVAIVSLALAIGPVSVIVAMVDAVLLRPLAGIPEPGRLVSIYHANARNPEAFSPLSWPDFEYYQRNARSFSGLLAYLRLPFAVRLGGRTESIPGELVNDGYFRVLGIPPRLGRDFDASQPGPAVMLGERLWRDRFGADPELIGRAIPIAGKSFTVIGIVPAAYRGIVLDWGDRPQLFVPMRFFREAVPNLTIDVPRQWGMHSVLVTGRLTQAATTARAEAEIAALARRIDSDNPERQRVLRGEWIARAMPIREARFWPGARSGILTILAVLTAVAACVLLIACANIASLLLTRAAQRQREISVRVALGAGTRQVVRLLLAESLVISLAGCAAGLLAGTALIRALAAFPKLFSIPLSLDLTLDFRAVAFTAALGVLASVAAGLAPLRHSMRADLAVSLRAAGAATRAGYRTWSPRNVLTAMQIALSLVLLVQAGLFLRTFRNASGSDPFLQAGNLLIAQVEIAVPGAGEARKAERALARDLPSRVRELPAVEDVVVASVLPASGMRSAGDITVLDPQPRQGNVDMNAVSPGFFAMAGGVLLRGRDFAATDIEGRPGVAIVNERMAEQYWKGDAIGRRLAIHGEPLTVVGIVRDRTRRRSYRGEVPPRLYFPIAQRDAGPLFLVIRARSNPMEVLRRLRPLLAGLAPDAILDTPQTLASYTRVALAQERLAAWCLSALAAVALALSLVGLYGTVAFSVAQRAGEIGIRVALGATSARVVGEMLRPAAIMSAAGVAAGSLLCAAATRFSQSLLYGVTGADPVTWLASAALLAAAVGVAAAIPAVRASRIDPAVALRAE